MLSHSEVEEGPEQPQPEPARPRGRTGWAAGLTYALPAVALLFAGVIDYVPALNGLDHTPPLVGLLATALLLGSAFSTMAHSDVVAARVGQPFGTLVLTLSVTVIEVSVIASIMLNGQNNPTLARESVFSVIMISTTGIVGLCLLLGSLRHHEQRVLKQGLTGYLSVIIALSVLLLVLPSETKAGEDGAFTPFQLGFMAFVAVGLYLAFLYMQTVRHREHYVVGSGEEEGPVPGGARVALAFLMLLASLGAVVALSHTVADGFETFLAQFPLADPDAVTGALVALLLLSPEGISAVRAAQRNDLQHSLNVALGSALATIALTIPVMAAISVLIGRPMILGLDSEDRTMLLLALILSILSFGTGRTNVLNGIVHLIVFAVYVMLLFVP